MAQNCRHTQWQYSTNMQLSFIVYLYLCYPLCSYTGIYLLLRIKEKKYQRHTEMRTVGPDLS